MRGVRAAIVAFVVLIAAAALVPAGAAALDSDLKHAYAFRVAAGNGYSIIGFAASQSADGRGEVVLFVARGNAYATYTAPATLTATKIEADLGRLGKISLDVTPSGNERTVQAPCGEPKKFAFEPWSYRGIFEFQGEQGYTEATAIPRDYTPFFSRLICSGVGSGEVGGAGLPGARLRLRSRQGASGFSLQANKNRPAARVRFEVETHEKHGKISISRGVSLWTGAGAFSYDPLLRTATLNPPAPFSGQATFRREATAANRWTGNLTVDLPGRSDVPLVGARATLTRACRHEGGGRFRC